MGDPVHEAKLREGAAAWNDWRETAPDAVPHLSGVELSAAERQLGPLHGGPVNFSRACLDDTKLNNALLSGADFTSASLARVDFSQARIDAANFYQANLADAIFDHADLAGADLTGAWIGGARLQDARNLTQEQIDRALGDASTALPSGLRRPPNWNAEAADAPAPADDDPYAILGLPRDATDAQIRRAYRLLAKAYHPDRAPANGSARFQAITEAARLLRDPDRRLLYDRGDIDFGGRLTSAGHSRYRKLKSARVYVYAAAALIVAAVIGAVASLHLDRETVEAGRDVKIAERAGAGRIAAAPAAGPAEAAKDKSRLAAASEAARQHSAPMPAQAETRSETPGAQAANAQDFPRPASPAPRGAGDVQETASINLRGDRDEPARPPLELREPGALPAFRPSFASAYFGALKARPPEPQAVESPPPLPQSRGWALLSRQSPALANTVENALRPAAAPAEAADESRGRAAVASSFAPARLDDWPRRCVLTPECKANEAWCTC